MSRRKIDRLAAVFACAGVLLALGWGAATAVGKAKGGGDSPVVPAHSKNYVKNCDRLSTEPWRWLLSIPADCSTGSDTTGEEAAHGESGNVWFLDGLPDANGTAVRKITVPKNKALFFPIFTYLWVNLPDFGDPPWSDAQEAEARQIAADQVD
jgi:prepilin-type processing-associated H-X9-DG protein